MIPILTITPIYLLNMSQFSVTIESMKNNMCSGDFWILVIDSKSPVSASEIEEIISNILCDRSYIVLNSTIEGGAGFTRNYGLEWCQNHHLELSISSLILTFLDADDYYLSNYFETLKKHFSKYSGIVTFSYEMVSSDIKMDRILATRTVSYHELCSAYSTSCLATAILVTDASFFLKHRFGFRKRANDLPFFLSCAREFGSIEARSDVVAVYNIGNPNSLSGRKWRMPYYRFLALYDHGLRGKNLLRAMLGYFTNTIKLKWYN